jgi:Arc/MetJ-type ribon-helix-helix transcriptional regulator
MTSEQIRHSEVDEEGRHLTEVEQLRRLLQNLELRAAATRADRGAILRRLQMAGRARKVSVSMPEDLTAAVQERVGRGEFSQYVTEAVARQLELDLLGDLSALLEAEHGPVAEELLAEASNSWPDAR